jgi:CHAT domain-containing protein/Tfp pilus assembly protein PilF
MRTIVVPMCVLLFAAAVHAQPAETVREVGKDGLTIEGKIAADDAKVKVIVAPGRTIELPAKPYHVKLEGGKSYKITMRSKELDSFLVFQDSMGRQVGVDDDSGGGLDAEISLAVRKDEICRIHAATVKGFGAFSLTVREETVKPHDPNLEHVVGNEGLKFDGRITAEDAKIKVTLEDGKTFELPAKRYLVKLAGGKSYFLSMRSKMLDSFLVVQNKAGKQIDYDDDSGGGLDAALTLDVKADAVFRIHAAALEKTGDFQLVIREWLPSDLPALSQADRATLIEGAALSAQATEFYRRGEVKSAIAPAGQALAICKKILGEQHPFTATTFNNLGFLLQAQGDLAAARPYLEQALAIRKKVQGEQHPDTATAFNNLGQLLQAQGDRAAARSCLEHALAIRTKVQGEQHPETAQSLNNLGLLLQAEGDWVAARSCYEQALAINRKILGEQHPDTARSLDNVGVVLLLQADPAAARPYVEQALAIRKKVLGEHHPDTAISLNNMGSLLEAQGDLAAARLCFEQALATRKKILGEQHPDTATSLNNLGHLLQAQGDLAAARPCYEQALAIRRKVQGEKHPDTAGSLNNLGNLLLAQGDLAAARSCYEQALAIRKKRLGELHPETATSLDSLAFLLRTQGDLVAARPYAEQALAINKKVMGEQHLDTAYSLSNMAALLGDQGDLAAARACAEQALTIRLKILGEQHPKTAEALNNLGFLLQAQGDLAMARPNYEQALAIRSKVFGEQHPETAISLNNLGNLLVAQGNLAAARPYLERALTMRKKVLGEQHPDTAGSLSNLGSLLWDQGDLAAAQLNFGRALAIQRRSLDLAADALGERSHLAMNDRFRMYLNSVLSISAEAAGPAQTDYEAVLAWKGAVTDRQQQIRIARRDPALIPLADQLRAVTVRLANMSLAVPDPKRAEAHRAELVRLTQARERLESELAEKSASFRQARRTAEPTRATVAKTLPSDAVLVDFLEYQHNRPDPAAKGKKLWERRLTAFVVAPGRPLVRVELGPAAKIASAVEDWRRQVIDKKPLGNAADDPGPTLRRLVWTPLEKHLAGAKTVLISPDGALTRLPFAALPGKSPGTYLLEDVTLAVLPLPRRLPQMATMTYDGDPSLLLVGDVDYGAASGKPEVVASLAPTRHGERDQYPQLKAAKAEIVAIQTKFAGRFAKAPVTLLEKSAATESAVRKEAAVHRYLHVATHGFFAPPEILSATAPRARPEMDLFGKGDVRGFHPGLLSGIVLAGANRPPTPGEDDGILTAMEVETIDLAKTELVVLSACETGLGKTAGGEGILGLQRAFQVAGAGSVVSSLWSVEDDATRLLMERFYDNLWSKKLPKAEALREAQLFLLREAPRQGLLVRGPPRLNAPQPLPAANRPTPPFYWAAFVLSGDWR